MKKILIVEDNELNLKLFHDLLVIKNFEIIVSRDGVDITNLVLKEKPNLIIMDIYLNQLLGTDLIKELKSNTLTKSTPIIVITAFAMYKEKKEILKSGCDLYLSKPVFIDHFYQAINQFINLKQHIKHTKKITHDSKYTSSR